MKAILLNISPERVELRGEAKKRRVDERSEVDPETSGSLYGRESLDDCKSMVDSGLISLKSKV